MILLAFWTDWSPSISHALNNPFNEFTFCSRSYLVIFAIILYIFVEKCLVEKKKYLNILFNILTLFFCSCSSSSTNFGSIIFVFLFGFEFETKSSSSKFSKLSTVLVSFPNNRVLFLLFKF